MTNQNTGTSDRNVETIKGLEQEQLERLGIRRVPTNVFYYRDYRYGKLDDAVAQAMRDQELNVCENRP